MKQIYMVTYPTGKIYIGKDTIGSYRYSGSPDIDVVNKDFMLLPEEARRDYPEIGYNRWPKFSSNA